MDVREELEKFVEDFFGVARISGVPLSRHKIELEILYAPQSPTNKTSDCDEGDIRFFDEEMLPESWESWAKN